jgi:hypothetical protein
MTKQGICILPVELTKGNNQEVEENQAMAILHHLYSLEGPQKCIPLALDTMLETTGLPLLEQPRIK